MSEVVDLRGREFTVPPPPVLSDPSGRRARWLARGGRVLTVLALLWVAGLVLAGLGVLPSGDVPLGRAVAGPQAPSGWRRLPTPTGPTAQDLSPAIPAHSTAGASGPGHGLQQAGVRTNGLPSGSPPTAAGAPRSASGSGSAQRTAAASTATGGALGIGLAAATSRGRSAGGTAPGFNKTPVQGNSGSSPGQMRQATTPTGESGSAPGHTAGMPGNGHPTIP